jgi:hypothetical protein
MGELKIKISELKADMQELTNKVDDFSRHGRNPKDEERFEQIALLENWLQLGEQLKVCEELLQTVQQNARILIN